MGIRDILLSSLLLAVAAAGGCTERPRFPVAPSERVVQIAKSGGGTFDLPIANVWKLDELQGRDVTPVPILEIASLDSAPAAGGNYRVEVRFRVTNYEVGQNSGQHVHVILDDRPYHAHYDGNGPVVLENVPPGRHTLSAFLARAYHLALKNNDAFVQRVFVVGDDDGRYAPASEDVFLLYSRPKGTYTRADGGAQFIMLDFYLRNTTLGPLTHRVRITADGGDTHDLLAWKPEILFENPAPGDHTVRLELLDRFNRHVEAPWNPYIRTFKVE